MKKYLLAWQQSDTPMVDVRTLGRGLARLTVFLLLCFLIAGSVYAAQAAGPATGATGGGSGLAVAVPTGIGTAVATIPPPVGTARPTATPCLVSFMDVPEGNPFYPYIRCLVCRGIVNGYACGGPGEPCPGTYFRPGANITRSQVTKLVANSAGYTELVTGQIFEDVPPSHPFYTWIERLGQRGIMNGYTCGGENEPCVAPGNRPYFRGGNNITRSQLAKAIANAMGYTEPPSGQTFEDVPPSHAFWSYVEHMAAHGAISGYQCGGPGEPCIAPGNRPYFRPAINSTRSQTAKIVANAFFPNCNPLGPRLTKP